MRILVVSDVHANLAALQAVLADAAGLFDRVWSLGDIVGYGPHPNECLALLAELEHISIPGIMIMACWGASRWTTLTRRAPGQSSGHGRSFQTTTVAIWRACRR